MALVGHSKGTWAHKTLRHSSTSGTQALGYSDTWALKIIYLAEPFREWKKLYLPGYSYYTTDIETKCKKVFQLSSQNVFHFIIISLWKDGEGLVGALTYKE